jgi:diadenylate cyclase
MSMPTMTHAFDPVAKSTRCSERWRETVEQVVHLGVEIAREGREGRKIGTLFTIGDTEEVLRRSHPLILDPLYGHAPELLGVARPEFRETVKELAQLDGAFVVDPKGTFLAAGRYLSVDLQDTGMFLSGLGTRHAAAASISRQTKAVVVVVSQSSVVRVYASGEVRAEIIPELFLMGKQQVFTRGAEFSQIPELGLTMAVASDAA